MRSAHRNKTQILSAFFALTAGLYISACSTSKHKDDWKPLVAQIDTINRTDALERILPIAKRAVQTTTQDSVTGVVDYLEAVKLLAKVYTKLSKFEPSLHLYEKAEVLSRQIYTAHSASHLSSVNALGNAYYWLKRNDMALKSYQYALDIALAMADEGRSSAITAHSNIANIYKEIYEYEKALAHLKSALVLSDGLFHWRAGVLSNLGELYVDMGDYQNALVCLKEAVTLGANHPYIRSAGYDIWQNNLASLYQTLGRYDDALKMLSELALRRREMYSEDSEYYRLSLNNLAGAHIAKGEYAAALEIFNKLIATSHDPKSGIQATELARLQNNLSTLYKTMGKPAEALAIGQQALQVRGNNQESSLSYATSLNNVANIYLELGQFDLAESHFEKSLEIRKRRLGEKHPLYAASLNNLAQTYVEKGYYRRAIPLLEKVLEITEFSFGRTNKEFAESMSNQALLYLKMGDLKRAQELSMAARQIAGKALGPRHAGYPNYLTNLAAIYSARGIYDKALPMFRESIEIREEKLGQDHPLLAYDLDNLANLYLKMGQFEMAQPLYEQALEIRSNVYGKKHPDYLISINNLGNLYSSLHQDSLAEIYIREATNLSRQIFGELNSAYATSLANLAILSERNGDHDSTILLLKKALSLEKELFGQLHPDYATALNNLGVVYLRNNEPEKSIPLFREALEVREKTLGKSHREYASSLTNLSMANLKIGNYEQISDLISEAAHNRKDRLLRDILFLGESGLDSYQQINDNTDIITSLQIARPALSLSSILYNEVLIKKGVSLTAARELREAIENKDTVMVREYGVYLSQKKRLQNLYISAKTNKKEIQKARNSIEAFEENIKSKIPVLNKIFSNLSIDWRSVQKSLKQDEAAIEFINFELWNEKKRDSTYYAALIVRPGFSSPVFIRLCNSSKLESFLSSASDLQVRKDQYVSRIYTDTMYNLIWAPIDPTLSGVKTIYYSTAGLLNRINFSALPSDEKTSLFEKYDLVQYGSTRNVAIDQTKANAPKTALLMGDIAFEMDPTKYRNANAGYSSDFEQQLRVTIQRTKSVSHWRPLNYTNEEVNTVDSILAHLSYKTTILKQWEASEEAFYHFTKRTGYNPKIIHIATHGYFQDASVNAPVPTFSSRYSDESLLSDYKRTQYSLIRSGVILAGGNYAWQGKPALQGFQDGILTAAEISQLNLNQTELVVLSACDSGLGDIGADGVYGLQRAFKIAGAHMLMASLWQVDDSTTKIFMQNFYKKLIDLPIRKAYIETLGIMKEKFRGPYFWAPFILIE